MTMRSTVAASSGSSRKFRPIRRREMNLEVIHGGGGQRARVKACLRGIQGSERYRYYGWSVPTGTPPRYEVVSDEEAVLAVSMTPALDFKAFIVASHALRADEYPANGLHLPYMALVAKG